MNSIHNNGENDKSLNDELDQVNTAYARIEQDEPPELLDQAILNSAHRAVEKKPHWMKFGWLHGLTTTAVFVLAFSLFLNQPETIPILKDGINNNESIRLESGKTAKKQAMDVRSLEVKSRSTTRQDTSQNMPVAATPMSVAKEIQPEARASRSTSEIQHSLDVQESVREKREFVDMDAEVSGELQEEVVRDEADMIVDALKVEANYKMSLPGIVAEPVLGEAETQVDDESGIEQELQAIIKLKQAGDNHWITELELFKERYPDYALPDVLTDQEP